MIILTYSGDENIWNRESNHQILVLKVFKDVFDSDKSENKTSSSELFKGVFEYSYYKSVLAHLEENDRLKKVNERYFGNKLLDNQKLKTTFFKLCDEFIEYQAQSPIRYLRALDKIIDKRTKFLENFNYEKDSTVYRRQADFDNALKTVDEMINKTPSLVEQRKQLEKIIMEQESSKIKGGRKLSLLAQNKLENNES